MSLASLLKWPRSDRVAGSDPDTDAVLRALAHSPVVAEALVSEQQAVIAAREALLARIAIIRETTAQTAKRLGQDAAAARLEAVAQHKVWVAAEQKHTALAVALFHATQTAEGDVQRIETQLATDPAMKHEFALLRDQIEEAFDRVRHTKPDFGGSVALTPSHEYPAPPIAGSGKAATSRHRQRAAAPEIVQWWANQDERLAAIRAMRARAAAATLLPDPTEAISAIRAELARLVRDSA